MKFPKRRFFFHYNKPASLKAGSPKLSFHYASTCYIVDKIDCRVPVESKVNKTQPRVVMQGFANAVTLTKELDGTQTALIQFCENCTKDKTHLCSLN